MALLITSFFVIAGCYLPLRLMLEAFYRGKTPKGLATIGGLLAWLMLLSLLGPVYAFVAFFVQIIDRPSMSQGYEVMGMVGLVALIVNVTGRFPEILEIDRMQPFLFSLLQFEDFSLRRENIFEALEKKELRDIYKEQSGKDPAEPARKEFNPTSISPEQALKELEEHRKKVVLAPSMAVELETLRSGGFVDITETFTLNALKRRTHAWYERVDAVRADAGARTLLIGVKLTSTREALANDTGLLHGVKEKMFEVVRFLWLEPWIKPFKEFVDTVIVAATTPTTNDFGLEVRAPFIRVEIPSLELRKREGRSYYAPELEPLSTITFENIDDPPTN